MPRPAAERAVHARNRLATEPNIWIASASADGIPHLVPLSLAWIDDMIVVATPSDTPTARNISTTGRARASLESADDVAILDTEAEAHPIDQADQELLARYIAAVGWDPRDNPGVWILLALRPVRGFAWNGVDEMHDRVIVRDGDWVDR